MQPAPSSPFAAFGPRNYRLMGLGLAVLAAGFLTMTLDDTQYGEGLLGITIGPILLVVGFIVEFFAIMMRDPATLQTAATNAAATAVVATDAPLGTAPPAAPVGLAGPATTIPIRPSYKPL